MAETYDHRTLIEWRPPPQGAARTLTEASLPPWEHFVVRSGEEGASWVKEYLAAGWQDLRQRTENAVRGLHKGRFDEAKAEFVAVREEMQRLEPEHSERRAVFGRWYYTGIAYYRYLTTDYMGALEDLDRAQERIETAIRQMPILLPLAHHCVEFQLLYARIARARRCWDTVRRHVAAVQEMAADRRVLCRYPQEEPLYMSTLDHYLLGLPRLTSTERNFLHQLLAKKNRIERLTVAARQIYALPGIVILYR